MKKLNKKGFTLIELMVVIAILVIIMGIALPNITSSIERSKEKQKQNKIQLVESAAELYFDKHRSKTTATVEEIIDDQEIPGVSATDICDSGVNCCVTKSDNNYNVTPSSGC